MYGAGDARVVKSWALFMMCVIIVFCVFVNVILVVGKEIVIGVFKVDKFRVGEICDCVFIMCGSFYLFAAILGL